MMGKRGRGEACSVSWGGSEVIGSEKETYEVLDTESGSPFPPPPRVSIF